MGADDGLLEGHTPGAGGERAPAGAGDGELGGGDPADLLLGLPDLDGNDVLALTADLANAERRARGRPAGSGNRKNNDMIAYLQSRGHRDPWVTLSMIQSADHRALCKMVGADTAKMRLAVLNVQRAAAEAILPYHHGKKPQQLELLGDANKRPLLAIGEVNIAVVAQGGYVTAGELPDMQQNQGVIEGETVRDSASPSGDDVSD